MQLDKNTFATELGVDPRTLENYAKEAKKLGIKIRLSRGIYDVLGLCIYFHKKWKRAEKDNQKNNFAKDQQEINYMLKNKRMLMIMEKEAGKLVPVDMAERAASFFMVATNSSIDTVHKEITQLLLTVTSQEVRNKIDERFNQLKIYLSQLKIEGKFASDDVLMDEEYTMKQKDENKNEG